MVVEVAEELLLLSLVQEPFLQHFLSEQDLVVALLSLDAEAVCCPKAKPVIPIIATAKNNFFIVVSLCGYLLLVQRYYFIHDLIVKIL